MIIFVAIFRNHSQTKNKYPRTNYADSILSKPKHHSHPNSKQSSLVAPPVPSKTYYNRTKPKSLCIQKPDQILVELNRPQSMYVTHSSYHENLDLEKRLKIDEKDQIRLDKLNIGDDRNEKDSSVFEVEDWSTNSKVDDDNHHYQENDNLSVRKRVSLFDPNLINMDQDHQIQRHQSESMARRKDSDKV